jgi:ABC-type lipoprotein export system ATPase subunit
VVVVSHDPRWKEFADRTITLSDGQIKQEEQRNNS